jgi:TP901 family phage tail tape measure protein
MPFSDFTAARGDVVFQTNLGQFRGDMAQIEAVYGRTTGAMSDEALRLAVAQEKLNRAIVQSGPESLAAGKATLAYRTEVNELATAQERAAITTQRAAQKQLAAYAGAARTVGSTLTRFVTVPAALVTAAAVKMGIDFQQQMLLIQTQAGASAAEVKKLSGEVLDFAHVAPQGPTQLAQGLYHLESIGLRDAKAMSTLKIASIAAGEGIANLEDVTTALGGVVVTGIKGAENYGQAMNTLIATVGAGNLRFEDLAGAIGNVTPAAAAAGVDLHELGAALATLTDRGFNADEAATRLRISLALIQSPSEKAKKALNDMGIDAETLGGILRRPNGLLKVLQLLHDGIDRVGKVRGNRDLLAAFGGGRSGLGIQTLVQSLDSPLSSYQAKLAQVTADEKKASAARQAYLKSDAYQLHAAISGVEADLVKFGGIIAPAFIDAAKGVSGLVDAIDKLPRVAKIEIGLIVGLLAVGGPLLLGIAAVVRAVQTIGAAFTRLPVQAGAAVAETDAELATLRATASSTGTLAGAQLAGGVGAGVATAGAEISKLRLALLGLGALVIAPIVIPIEYHVIGKLFRKIPGVNLSPIAPDVTTGGTFAGFKLAAPADTSAAAQIAKLVAGKHLSTAEIKALMSEFKLGQITSEKPTAKEILQFDLAIGRTQFGFGAPAPKAAPSKTTPPRWHFTTTLPNSLQLQLASAQLRGDVSGQRAALQAEQTFLQQQLRHATTESERLEATNALINVQQELQSLTKTGERSAKKTADTRKRAYQTKLTVEENKLKINLDRARLAETQAGKNKALLDRAYKAEKKALTDEIEFYRKEAADQQLATTKRQHYAELEIAAEKARAKIGQKTSKAKSSTFADLEREFLESFQQIVGNFAPNYTAAAASKPTVTINQTFHDPTVDRHREAHLAKLQMQAVGYG